MKHIHIIYRHYSTESSDHSTSINKIRPEWFCYESCFRNLLDTVKDKDNITIHMMMDSADYKSNFISKYGQYYILHQFDSRENNLPIDLQKYFVNPSGRSGDINAFLYMVDYLRTTSLISDDDVIYILENDYLHVHEWVQKVVDLYDQFPEITDSNYVTTYYNPRKHTHQWFVDSSYNRSKDYDHGRSDKIFSNDHTSLFDNHTVSLYTGRRRPVNQKILSCLGREHYWSSTIGTVGTYMSTKKTYMEDLDIFIKVMTDYIKWFYLLQNKNRMILEPIPTLSTHCMSNLAMLSPGRDWKALANEYKH